MRCEKARARIQEWFDTPGAPPMPDVLRDHVRECGACRALITRWNAVELSLQSLREQTPNLSPDYALRLQSRLRAEAAGANPPGLARHWGLAALAASMAALLLFLVLRLLVGAQGPARLAGAPDAASPPMASAPVRPDAARPISPGMPLVNTP